MKPSNPFIRTINVTKEEAEAFIQWLKDNDLYHPVEICKLEINTEPVIKFKELNIRYYTPFEIGSDK